MTLPSINQIYVASHSPRRRQLLKQFRVNFDMRPVSIDETMEKGETPVDYVCRMARAKAEMGWLRLIQRGLPLRPLLAAATVVVLKGKVIGKPDNLVHGRKMLSALSGQTHKVLTAVTVVAKNKIEESLSTTTIKFRDINQSEITSYLNGSEWNDRAGSYEIQGIAAAFIIRISGSYSGALGLPIFETAQLLEKFNIKIFRHPDK
jgi:septum formation protein